MSAAEQRAANEQRWRRVHIEADARRPFMFATADDQRPVHLRYGGPGIIERLLMGLAR